MTTAGTTLEVSSHQPRRFKPDLALTFRPCRSTVTLADFDMLLAFKSSMTIIAWFLLISMVTLWRSSRWILAMYE